LTVSVQEVVRQGLRAVAQDRATVIPGTLVSLLMTSIAFVPMFLKRLVLNAQATQSISASSKTPLDYEISGMV
jgi:hypothetical protein